MQRLENAKESPPSIRLSLTTTANVENDVVFLEIQPLNYLSS
jgi:hypothetical protein